MKVGLISDIHGNADALRAVLDAARRLQVDRLLSAGDLIGYYDQPAEVLGLLAGWNVSHVRGNHERMLSAVRAGSERLPRVEESYGPGLRLALETLDSPALDWLEGLPDRLDLEVSGRRLVLCHGSPWDPDLYIYPDAPDRTWDRCASMNADVIVCGHTHHPLSRKCGDVLLVNSGSVGQPRNRVPGAHWALLDVDRMQIEHRVETYDVGITAARILAANPSIPSLSEVLLRS